MKGREQLFYKNPHEIPNFEKRAYLENFSKIKIFHYHTNHLGTPQELSDDKGDIVWLSYDRAWGGQFDCFYKNQEVGNVPVSETELQPIKFQGQFFDKETSLHYNRFRYYDSDVGMFISRDPIGLLGGSNVFQYAPNPIGWIDPWGLSSWIKTNTLGRSVYQNDNLFDTNKKSSWKDNTTGKWKYGTNIDRMADGYAPVGKDGKPVQLHHLTQTELNVNGTRGSIAEISTTSHTKYSKTLHFPAPMQNPNRLRPNNRTPNPHKGTIPRYPSFRMDNNGNRTSLASEFDLFRSDYWKERAKNLKSNPCK